MKRGFTLIELLVVIAIIGILSAVVLASINGGSASTLNTVNGAEVPAPTNYAVDTAGALTTNDLNALNAQLKTAADQGQQIGVVVVESLNGTPIEHYAKEVAETWRVGDAETNNGVIIILATKDREMRIEVGNGFQGELTDAESADIVRNVMAPKFKAGDWYGGLSDAVAAIRAHDE